MLHDVCVKPDGVLVSTISELLNYPEAVLKTAFSVVGPCLGFPDFKLRTFKSIEEEVRIDLAKIEEVDRSYEELEIHLRFARVRSIFIHCYSILLGMPLATVDDVRA